MAYLKDNLILSTPNFVLSKSVKRLQSYGTLKKVLFCVHSTMTLCDFVTICRKTLITLFTIGIKPQIVFFSKSVMHNQTLKLSSSNLCISIFSNEVSNESSFHAEPGYIVIVGDIYS